MFLRHSGSNCSRKAFTLLELLVVIAIISLLAAILFPVFSRARENARRSTCLSNMKEIGLGIVMYSQDNDEYLPGSSGQAPYPNPNGFPTWRARVYPYIKTRQVFICPDNPKNAQTFDELLPDGTKMTFTMSYKSNGNSLLGCSGSTPMPPNNTGLHLNRLVVPAETILIAEGNTDQAYFDWGVTATPPGSNRTIFIRHLGTANFTFADGHSKALKLTATINPRNMWSIEDDGACTSGGVGTLFYDLNAVQADNE